MVRRLSLTLCLFTLASLATASLASADRTFSVRYASTQNGSTLVASNTVMTCPGSGSSCTNARAGTNTNDNGDYDMTFVNTDADAYTSSNSSTATLDLPTGATVVFAGLYWGADTDAGTNGVAAPNAAQRNLIDFKAPGALYSTITASVVDNDSGDTSSYQGFADVTSIVQAAGEGTYAAGDIQAGTGQNRYGGWALVVAYGDTAEPFQRIHVYDGFQVLESGGVEDTDIALTDFLTPASGTVNGRLGVVSWEGDRSLTGDTMAFGGVSQSDAVNPVDDFFNSTITRDAAHVTTKNPNYVNQLGMDSDETSINGDLGNSVSSANIHLETTGDRYMPGVVTLSTDEGPPLNTAVPTISGTPTQGQVLTANPGTWLGTPALTYSYQWRRCNAAGASCVDIGGATATTYTLAGTDVGSTIRVVVTVSNAAGSGNATSAQTATVTGLPPVNTVLPVISGTTTDGQTLSSTTGTWTGTAPITYTYQWRRCNAAGASCANIAGATASTYALVGADIGQTIRVVVTGTNSFGNSSATSNQTAVIAAAPPVNTVLPVISGTTTDGQTLSGSSGTWTGTTPISYTYQWRRCNSSGASCANIAGATASNYTLVAADIGQTVRIVVTATNVAGNASATSNASAVIAAAPPVNTVLPVISGTTTDGQTLSSTTGTWTGTAPITYTYQWRRCNAAGASCANIAGATSSTYALVGADVGQTIRIVVTGTNVAGNSSATSTQSAVIAAAPPVNTVLPVISGGLQDGGTLTTSNGTWTGTTPITYTYQWRRCNAAGASCANIAGATSSTYTLGLADIGQTLRSVVTGTNVAGNSSATSNPSGLILAAPPVNTVPPVISGTTTDGQTLGSTTGTWIGTAPITYTYQWRRCNASGASCANIAGATSSTYTLVGADVGQTLRSVVTGTNVAGNSSATSTQSAVIAPAPPVNTVLPVISGTLVDGQALSATTGTWTGTAPISYSYQWRRCDSDGTNCADIAGATSSTYGLVGADVDRAVRVVVTGSNVAGSANATSAASGEVDPAPPVNQVPPTISGTTVDGSTLTVSSDGTWTGTAPISYTYQWQRCDADGLNCANIVGETGVTYTLGAADVDNTLVVVVTATNAAGFASATSDASDQVEPAPPVNTDPPVISGSLIDGGVVNASNGDWTGTAPISYTYQWQRCDADGLNCANIVGATNQSHNVSAADVDNTLVVVVTATNAAGFASATSDASDQVEPAPPVNTDPPVISGSLIDGGVVNASNGDWTGTAPISYTYQWQRCDADGLNCANIVGATNQSHNVSAADVDNTLVVVVTATNAAGFASATSDASDQVEPAPPVNTDPPVISGTLVDGGTVSTSNGDWTGTEPITYTYQWQRCDADGDDCEDIDGATNQTHNVSADDVDHTLRAVVTATNAADDASETSAASAEVDAAAPDGQTPPAITGTPTEGQTLTSSNGTWGGTAPFTFTYQWQRCDSAGANCVDISGATSVTYVPGAADVGQTLRTVVTATNDAGSDSQTTAAAGPIAPLAPVVQTPPVITGEPRVGSELSSSTGTWTSSAPLTYTYQWQRCDASGANCVNIDGATSSTYTATAADEGKVLRVVVTATNSGGSASAATAGTDAVQAAATVTPPATPAAPATPATPAAPVGEPTSLVADGECVMLASGAGYRRIQVPGNGAVRQRVKATGAVSPKAPLLITVDAKGLRGVRYALDGKAHRAVGKTYLLKLAPAQLAPGTHKLVTTITPRGGKARTLSTTLRVIACKTVLSAAQWRTTAGTGLRLRVDSRAAISSVSFKVPAALAKRLSAGKPASSLRVGLPGGERLKVAMKSGAGVSAGTSVRVKGGVVTVSGLPAKAGIVEVTMYQPRAPKGPKLLPSGRSARVTATVTTTSKEQLSFVITGGGSR